MDFYKPTYMLELELDGSITDGKTTFKAYSKQLWNYTNTVSETADKKQMQADWCRINKGALKAGFSALGRENESVQRLLANKLPKKAFSVARMHFIYVNTGASRLFCVWQFINEKKMQAVAEAEAWEAAEAAEAIRQVAEAEAAATASQAAAQAEADAEVEEEAILQAANSRAAAQAAQTTTVAPTCFCASSISQIEARLNALETSSTYSMQLGVLLGLLSANEGESVEEGASEAEADAEPVAEPVADIVTDDTIREMMTDDNNITDLLNNGQPGMIVVFKNLRKQLQYGILTTASQGGTVYNYRPLKRVENSLKFEYYDDPNFKHPNTNNQIGAGRKIHHLQNASLC